MNKLPIILNSFRKKWLKIKPATSFIILQAGTYIFFIFALLMPFFYPSYFTWINHLMLYVWASLFFLTLNTVVAIYSMFSKKFYLKYIGYIWLIWYIIFILATGGVNSTFTFALLSLPIISVSYLDSKLTRNICILSAVLLASVIFIDNEDFSIPNITLHILHIVGYCVLVTFVYKFVNNILYHKYQEEEAKRKFLELSEIDHAKEIFLTAMSHQLRTPLTATKWALDSMMSGKKKIDPKMLKMGYDGVERSLKIIGDILKTAELDVGAHPQVATKYRISLVKIIKDIVSSLDYLIYSKNVKIIFEKMEDAYISGDEKMLDIALGNVINNAIMYSPGGEVRINISQPEGKAKITISDNGVGIDSSDLEYIFQKFYRGRNALLLNPNESGIGLYTAKKILELHNGEIKISSVLKKGTIAEITLPLA